MAPKGSGKNPVRILIPKKIARRATRRNRLRRLIKEAIRLKYSPAVDKIYLLKAWKDPGDVGLFEVVRTLDGIWKDG